MDRFVASLVTSTAQEQAARYSSIRNHIAATKEPFAPKIAVFNLRFLSKGVESAAHLLGKLVHFVRAKNAGDPTRRLSPRIRLSELADVAKVHLEHWQTYREQVQIAIRQGNDKDDDRETDVIVIDLLKLDTYITQITDRYEIPATSDNTQIICRKLLRFLAEPQAPTRALTQQRHSSPPSLSPAVDTAAERGSPSLARRLAVQRGAVARERGKRRRAKA